MTKTEQKSKNQKSDDEERKKEERKKVFFYTRSLAGKPANCSFTFYDFFSLLFFIRISSSVQCFSSNHKVKVVWFTDLVLFLALCNRAHMLNKPSKGKQ